MTSLKIGEAARLSAVPAKTIRYYEEIGLLPPSDRTEGGYRIYGGNDVEVLRFVKRARDLGFPLEQVAALLELWRDRGRSSAEVRSLAEAHVAEVERKISELESLRDTLIELVHQCHGDHRPDCPILEDLAGGHKEE